MKKKLFLISLFLFFFMAMMAQEKKLTLKQCVETGIANNLDVQQSGFEMERSKVGWNQAKLNMLPNLNGSIGSGINRGRSIDPFTNSYINERVNYTNYGLSSGVILFNGFSMRNTIKQNGLAYEASKMDWQQTKDDITINIILAYLQVLANEDQLEQAHRRAEVSKKQVERQDILDKDGAGLPSQLSDFKGENANDLLSIVSTQNTLETSKISLCQLMNIPYDKNIQLERLSAESYAVKYEDTPDKIYQESLQKFSLIKSVDLRKQSSEWAVKAAKGRLFPTLSLNGNINTNYSSAALNSFFVNTTDITTDDYVVVSGTPTPVIHKQSNFRTEKIKYGKQLDNNLANSISLNLRIPLFNSFQTRNNIKLAQITLKNDALVASTTKTQLQQDIEQAHINMITASDRHKILLEQVAAYTESFRIAEVRFNAGVGTSIDYLTAKRNIDFANINLINARYDFILRAKILDYYKGKELW